MLYKRVLGDRFSALPGAVRELHDVSNERRWRGACEVTRGAGLMARMAAWLGGLPPATEGMRDGFCYEVRPAGDVEVWSRGFAGVAPFVTRQWPADGLLCERAGPVVFGFAVQADGAGLRLVLERCWVMGVPLPKVLHPRISAVETDVDGVFRFDVAAQFPWGAFLVGYRGWLVAEDEPNCD